MSMETSSVAIFCCTADPFTIAHRAIVEEVINKKIADKVLIVPTIVNWHRKDKSQWLSGNEKITVIDSMMKYANIHRDQWNLIEDELDTLREMPTVEAAVAFRSRRRFIDTLLHVQRRYCNIHGSGIKFKVIIGQDEFDIFKQWESWETILKLASLVVVGRNIAVSPPKSDIPHETVYIDAKYNDVSATSIRKRYLKERDNRLALSNYLIETCPNDVVVAGTPIFQVIRKRLKDTTFMPVQIKSPDWVTIMVKNSDEFFVVKQVRYGLERPFMEFPCGMVEHGELAAHAAVRELEEETGIRLTNAQNDLVFLGKIPTNPAFMTNYMHYFYVDLETASFERVEQHLDEHEKLIVSSHNIDNLFYRAYNPRNEEAYMTPALMCTALFLYNHYRKYPSDYKKGVTIEN